MRSAGFISIVSKTSSEPKEIPVGAGGAQGIEGMQTLKRRAILHDPAAHEHGIRSRFLRDFFLI